MKVEGCLNRKHGAVVKADESRCHILNVVGVLVGCSGRSVSGLVFKCLALAHSGECRAENSHRLGSAHKVTNKVDNVYAKVDKRSAAGARLICKPTAGTAVSSEVGRLCVVDISEISCIDKALGYIGIVSESSDESDHKLFAVLLCGVDHSLSLYSVKSHRLLAKNVLSRVESHNRCGCVSVVPGTYADRVDLGKLAKHGSLVGVKSGYAVLFTLCLKGILVNIAKCVKLNLGVSEISLDVALRNVTDTDNRNFYLSHFCYPPFYLTLYESRNLTASAISFAGVFPHSRSIVRYPSNPILRRAGR